MSGVSETIRLCYDRNWCVADRLCTLPCYMVYSWYIESNPADFSKHFISGCYTSATSYRLPNVCFTITVRIWCNETHISDTMIPWLFRLAISLSATLSFNCVTARRALTIAIVADEREMIPGFISRWRWLRPATHFLAKGPPESETP